MRAGLLCITLLCISSLSFTAQRTLDPYRVEQARIESHAVRLAREAVTSFLDTGKARVKCSELPGVFETRAPVFVTISRGGRRRACAGRFEPVCSSLREEIIRTAVEAAVGDRRYRPVRLGELDNLTFTVSIVGDLKPVSDPSRYRPAVFGLLVRSGSKSGVILPGEARTTEWGLAEARRQAGIHPGEPCEIYVFETVTLRERPRSAAAGRR